MEDRLWQKSKWWIAASRLRAARNDGGGERAFAAPTVGLLNIRCHCEPSEAIHGGELLK